MLEVEGVRDGPEVRPLRNAPAGGPAWRPRLAFYSHDAQGLGHLRRNLLISRALSSDGCRPNVLLISGLREASSFELPPGVDHVTLPSLGKSERGTYFARSLGIGASEVVGIRRKLIAAAVEAFHPDVLVVDKLPLGFSQELEPALVRMRTRPGARVVLGLRDILDEPATVAREWAESRCLAAIRSFYDRVWVYGDARVYDATAEYDFPPDVSAKVRFTGYLNPRDVRDDSDGEETRCADVLSGLPAGSLTLCVIGGGRDGVPVATAFLQSELPARTGGVLLCGPLMDRGDRGDLRALAAARSDMRVLQFVADPRPLLCCADRIITMGGYNSVCEALAYQKRTLIVPRVTPRSEQLIRATRLAGLGLVDVLHPKDLDGAALTRWMRLEGRGVEPAVRAIDFGGVGRLPTLLREAMAADNGAACRRTAQHV